MVTKMGSSSFFVAMVIMTTFGIDFKKGFLLFQLLIWTGMVTETLKTLVAFPRPDFVDNRVLNLEYGIDNTSPFSGNGSEGIFELPDKQVLQAFRLQDEFTPSPFGFPSGHVALTAALWGGSTTLFNNRTFKRMVPLAIILMAFSRMYLGRHFLGDVFGGAIVGLISLIAFTSFLKSPLKEDFFKKESFEFAFRYQNLLFYSFMFVIPILLMALSLISAEVAGFFLGTNFAYFLIIRKGIPDDTGNKTRRFSRVFIASFLFGVSSLILDIGFETAGTVNYLHFTLLEFLKTFVPSLTIWISVVVCTKLELYRRDSEGYDPLRVIK
jgi:membrane-associated phospholipid phosphatase